MEARRKGVVAAIAVSAVALVAAVTIAAAGAATRSDGSTAAGDPGDATTFVVAGKSDDSLTGLLAGARQAAVRLLTDEDFRADLTALRDEAEADAEAWSKKYGDTPGSEAAQAALRDLAGEHRTAVRRALSQHGVDVDGLQRKAERLRATADELMKDDAFRADLWQLRDAWEAEMDAWWDQHADDPRTQDARDDMGAIQQEYGGKLSDLLERNGVDVPDGAGALLRGLSGMTGGGTAGGGLSGVFGDHAPL
jgi:hypothetical protein